MDKKSRKQIKNRTARTNRTKYEGVRKVLIIGSMNANKNTFKPLPKLILDKKRFRVKECPCGKSNKDGKFVPYLGYENKGFCHGCGYTFLPELKSNDENWKFSTANQPIKKQPEKNLPVSSIPLTIFKESLKHHLENNFIKYILSLFGSEITSQLISKYFIGTSKLWNGATVFWQIDIAGKIRTGKIMLYNAIKGKRIKEPYNHTNWAHSALKLPGFALQQAFFGEHLLKGNNMPVAIVESEKTAIIASVYLPQFIWLAAGNKTGLTGQKCKVLQGRKVILYPDLNAFELWKQKAKEYSHIFLTVSSLLERKATEDEKKQGLDLADYLIRFDLKEFQNQEIKKSLEPVSVLIDNIIAIPTETITGFNFENMNIVWLKTINGSYDVLFDAGGEPVKEITSTVKKLAAFFEKDFKPAFINGQKCLAHMNN